MFPRYEYRNNPIYISLKHNVRQFPARFHKQLEIHCVLSGEMQVNVDGKSYTLRENEMYIAFPNILHAVLHAEAEGMLIIVDSEMFPLYTEALTHFKPETPVIRAGSIPPIVYGALTRIRELNEAGEHTYKQAVLTGYITAVLGEILEQITLVERDSDSDLIQKLILYILNNYTQEISLEDVARELSYSKCYISHLIAETFQCNFRSLINSYRVSLAQSLLLSSQQTISEVSYRCGFKNQSSFNRIFLKYSGKTPSQFRSGHDVSVDMPKVYPG